MRIQLKGMNILKLLTEEERLDFEFELQSIIDKWFRVKFIHIPDSIGKDLPPEEQVEEVGEGE